MNQFTGDEFLSITQERILGTQIKTQTNKYTHPHTKAHRHIFYRERQTILY